MPLARPGPGREVGGRFGSACARRYQRNPWKLAVRSGQVRLDMRMPYRLMADLVLVLHAAFVAFVMLGGLLVLRWPRAAWVHLPDVLWGAGIEFFGGLCPLTPLEFKLRRLAGDQGYDVGFIEHYIVALL